MKWETHYTGFETKEFRKFGFKLYVQKKTGKRMLTFVRLSKGIHSIGAFIGTTNYSKGHGIELFTNSGTISLIKEFSFKKRFSGSRMMPFETTVRHLGFLVISYKTSPRLKELEERKLDEYMQDPNEPYFQ